MTSPDPERLVVRVPDHVVYRDFAEQTVALNLQTGRYHGLNQTAAAMLGALREAPSVAAAAAAARARVGRRHPRRCSPTCWNCVEVGESRPARDSCRRVNLALGALERVSLVGEIVVTYAVVRWHGSQARSAPAVARLRRTGGRRGPRGLVARGRASPGGRRRTRPLEVARRLALPDEVAGRPGDARPARHRRTSGPGRPAVAHLRRTRLGRAQRPTPAAHARLR